MIKVGFCASYDWEMMKMSLPLIYADADMIIISIDQNRRTWSGNQYDFDETSFKDWLVSTDVDKKITLYEDDFCKHGLSPIENDTRQRNLMARKMGRGGWHLQVDADEYFLDFQGFCQYLKKLSPSPAASDKPMNVNCTWVPVIKRLKKGYLYVPPVGKRAETTPVATNVPEYTAARRNGHFNHLSPFYLVHETWARSEDALRNKMDSWGHSEDFDKELYFKKWLSLNESNHHKIQNFHPLKPELWAKLAYLEAQDMTVFLNSIIEKLPKANAIRLAIQNNRLLAKLSSLFP